ncbi:hypothetical protein [Sandaracinus amylolyticus]|uniref:hypothetical protein n=1 Tax=Sandaracinus amylolyticus TaxID=927083 RepID=UPI001F4572FE|nr:hypothetical protein [Sandaracinus amylolyticus]UJR86465.1 Hypothetical protein I5071_85600 [Sandaracinus amylolyticus]
MIDLHALREKYREMKRLREQHDAGSPVDPRPAMRALATRFPGALREIDELPMDAIDARIASLDRALSGAEIEPWMRALARYHAWMRLALRLRLACASERSEARAREWLEGAARPHDDDVDPRGLDDATLHAILRPPEGRLHRVVLARVALELGVDAQTIDGYLKGPRRR